MLHRRWQILPILSVLVLALVLVGCAKRPATTSAAAPAPGGPAPGTPGTGTGPGGMMAGPGTPGAPGTGAPGGAAGAMSPPGTPPSPREFTALAALQDIHFDFDKYDLRPGDAKTLDENAKWMKANPTQLILIEGHCDERGTNEYNLALGERRAKATMNYLVSQGVQANRMTLISYGEERPQCTEKTEGCWTKNRRAHFLGKAR